MNGHEMHALASRLYPIPRSLTGDGNRQTVRVLQEYAPLVKYEVPTGTEAFDWTVPDEWNLETAWVDCWDPRGTHYQMFAGNGPLRVVGYSVPVDQTLDREGLVGRHLHVAESCTPYVTTYYKSGWGFCAPQAALLNLKHDMNFRARIDADLSPGSMTYADLLIPGETRDEVLFTTYICHPQQANDGLSGMVVQLALIRWLMDRTNRYSYRFVFAPETLGAIVYISRHRERLQRRVKAGYVLTCCGDPGLFSYVPSRAGDTLADRAAISALNDRQGRGQWTRYTWLDRGSDERQYCAPGVDLPVCWVGRSKWGAFDEYHTSLDDLDFITPAALQGTLEMYKAIIRRIEHNRVYRAAFPCEPMLSKRGLYATTSKRGSQVDGMLYTDVHSMSDGTRDTLAVAEAVGRDAQDVADAQVTLTDHGVLDA